MKIDAGQYERMAQWLDGRNVELSADEMRGAERFGRAEAQLGAMLDVAIPADALERLRARAHRAAPVRVLPLRRWAAVAAAAVLLVAAGAAWRLASPARTSPGTQTALPPISQQAVRLAVGESPVSREIDRLTTAARDLETDLTLSSADPGASQLRMDREMRDLLSGADPGR
jgi:hypothetical protein